MACPASSKYLARLKLEVRLLLDKTLCHTRLPKGLDASDFSLCPGHCSSFTGAFACHNISCHIGHHDPWDVILHWKLRTFTTDDYHGLIIWLSWKFLCLGRRLLCYHIVLSSCMHGSWPRTERFALVRLRIRRTTQSKDRDEFFLVIVCFTSIGKTGSFHHVLLGAGPLVGKGKRSKLAAILLLPGYYSSF
jgi:hypothetical protein